MALLNYAKTYAEVSGKLNIEESHSGDYVKLYFTGEGDIITHGLNYLPLFTQINNTRKGLVPGNTSNNSKEILRGNGTWAVITTADLPIGTLGTYNDTTLLTSSQIKQLVDTSFVANEAMRFKGTISWNETTLKWNVVTVDDPSTVKEVFPVAADIGDTYRIGNDSKQVDYADLKGSTGDLMICIKAYSNLTANEGNSKDYWTIVETNINGYVTNSVNGTLYKFYSPENKVFNIYAPDQHGSEGLVLISQGENKAPIWTSLNNIIAGKTKASLSAGTGLFMDGTYNGSTAKTIQLLAATNNSLGGVIIGAALEENPTITLDNGRIYLTASNIIAALGYTPGNQTAEMVPATTKSIGGIKVGFENGSASNAITTIGPKNYAIHIDSNKLGYVSLPDFAAANTWRAIKVGGTQLKGTGTTTGAINFIGSGKTTVTGNGDNITIASTWRDIRIGGASIGDNVLNFIPSGDVYVKVDDNDEDGSYDISFGLSWWNISANDGNGAYEYAN